MTLFSKFEVLEEPRNTRGKVQIIRCFNNDYLWILYRHTDFTNIVDFIELKEDYFTELLRLENAIPS